MSSGEYIMDNYDDNNYSTEWERCVKVGLFDKKEVKEIFKKGLITAAEYKYAIEFMKE